MELLVNLIIKEESITQLIDKDTLDDFLSNNISSEPLDINLDEILGSAMPMMIMMMKPMLTSIINKRKQDHGK